jgi:riboflavin synthase
MFTGIIEDLGVIRRIDRKGDSASFIIETSLDLSDTKIGDSISVNGVCLTIVSISKNSFGVDISHETLSRSNLSLTKVNQKLNLERALKLSDRLGGHIVTGHVDGLGEIKRILRIGEYIDITISIPDTLSKYIIEKGSVAVDGISLTVNSCKVGEFSVTLIPHTILNTTLGIAKPGYKVNIENDIIGKYIEHLLIKEKKEGITYNFLERHGYT